MDTLVVRNFLSIVPQDLLRFILAMLSSLFLGFAMRYIGGRNLRLIYGLFFGALLQYYVYGIATLHTLLGACVNLLIIKFCPILQIGKISIIYSFVHNSLIHLYRIIYFYDDPSLEISMTFMMSVCKYSAFAYCYQDGYINSLKTKPYLPTEEQTKNSIKKFSFLEYFSWIYFYPTCQAAPFIEFNDYLRFIDQEGEYANIPSTVLPALQRFLCGLIMSVIYILGKPYAQVSIIANDGGKYTLLQRVLSFVVGSVYEFKYFSAFFFLDAGIIACGFAYTGNEGDTKWGKVLSVDFINLELVYNTPEFFRYWNITCHVFLKKYVYFRSVDANSSFAEKSLAQSKTFIISGIWHGFHPAYLIVFVHFYFCNLFCNQIQLLFKTLNIKEVPYSNVIVFFLRVFILTIMVPYHCYMFTSLDYVVLIKFFKAVYAFGSILVILLNIIVYSIRLGLSFVKHKAR